LEKEYIESQQVICVVMEDISVGENNPLGQAVISLRNACGEHPVSFTETINYNGYDYGTISGLVQVTGTVAVKGKIEALKSFAAENKPSS